MHLYDSYAWWTWAEALGTDAPRAEVVAEAARFPNRHRHCLPAWCGNAVLPVASIARAFPVYQLGSLGAEHCITHVDTLGADSLESQLAAVPKSAVGFAIHGAETGTLSVAESAALCALESREVEELTLLGVPRVGDVASLRGSLRRLDLTLQSKPSFEALFAEPWPSLETLRLQLGTEGDMKTLAELLPTFTRILPACRQLELFETEAPPKLMNAMVASPWVAQLAGLQVHDGELSAGALAKLAKIPFEGLDYLGLGALSANTKTAKALAKSPHLKGVTALEISGAVGKSGLSALLDAWPELRGIAIWDAPDYDDRDAVIDAYALDAFVSAGGLVQARVC